MKPLRSTWTVVAASVVVAAACSPASAEPAAHVTMWSQIGDYIGAGGLWDLDYSPSTSKWFQVIVGNSIDGVPSAIVFDLGTTTPDLANSFMTLTISTDRLRRGIQPGPYPRASLPPQPGRALLDIGFQNRGCGGGTHGALYVQEFRYADAATVDRLVLGFKQACEGSKKDLYGIFWYDARGQPPLINDATRAAIIEELRRQPVRP